MLRSGVNIFVSQILVLFRDAVKSKANKVFQLNIYFRLQ